MSADVWGVEKWVLRKLRGPCFLMPDPFGVGMTRLLHDG